MTLSVSLAAAGGDDVVAWDVCCCECCAGVGALEEDEFETERR